MVEFQLRMEIHSHTDYDPQDWIEHSAEALIDEVARQGINVLAITCHRALQWSSELKAYAEAAGVLLIPAVEASIEGKDVLIYGLERFTLANGFAHFIAGKDFQKPVFTNTRGHCDEDLYGRVLAEARSNHETGRPFFITALSAWPAGSSTSG